MVAGRTGQLPQGSCSKRPLQNATAACLPLLGLLLLLLVLQAPSMVLSQAPVVAGRPPDTCRVVIRLNSAVMGTLSVEIASAVMMHIAVQNGGLCGIVPAATHQPSFQSMQQAAARYMIR
jgi:hypothetical protein